MDRESRKLDSEPAPRPAYAPALLAVGLMLLAWGVATTWVISVAGLALIGIAASSWMKDVFL